MAASLAQAAPAVASCGYPGKSWERRAPGRLGLDPARLRQALDFATTRNSASVAVYRHGCLAGESRLDAVTREVPLDEGEVNNEADGIHMPTAKLQPIAASDVSAALADVAVATPVNGTIEIAGPEPIGLDMLVRRLLEARGDERRVITDADALYFGAPLNDQTLTPAAGARLGPTHFADWLTQSATPT